MPAGEVHCSVPTGGRERMEYVGWVVLVGGGLFFAAVILVMLWIEWGGRR